MRSSAWCWTIGWLAAVSCGCGRGDHSRRADLGQLFGAGAAGAPAKVEPPPSATPPPKQTRAAAEPVSQRDAAGGASMPSRVKAAPTVTLLDAGSAMPVDSGSAAAMSGGGACPTGYVASSGECVCDVSGRYQLHASISVSFPAMAPVESLDSTIELLALLDLSHDRSERAKLTLILCGQLTPDLCADARPPVISAPEAYAQYLAVNAWDGAAGEPGTGEMSLVKPIPGTPFDSPLLAQLLGIRLSDPLGAWPASYKAVEGSSGFAGTATNGAFWIDTDADTKPGVTSYLVGPQGSLTATSVGPQHTYSSRSAACPRRDPSAARSGYAYLPLPQGLGVKRVKALYMAQRFRFELHGALESCDRITGALTGSEGQPVAFDALVGGCSTLNGNGEAECGAALLDTAAASGGGAVFTFGMGTFELTRVDSSTTCSTLRQAATVSSPR